MDSILDQNHHDEDFEEFENVPLPNQLPTSSPQKSFEMPEIAVEKNTLKSRTVQTLLSQNQDLMARLTVALKRNIELEQKVENQEDLYQSLNSQYDILKDQSAIHLEKNKHLEFENQRLFDQSSAIEKRFAELYSVYQDKINYIQTISYRLHRYLQYRQRIKGYVRPFIAKLKNEIVDLKNQILVLNEQGIKQLEFITDLKNRLASAHDRIQTISSQNEKTQLDLTQYHESRFQEIFKAYEVLKIETDSLREQNENLKKQVEDYAENEATLSNKSIFFERKYTDLKNEFQQISQEFIHQKTADNSRLTTLEIQLKELSSHYAKLSDQKTELEKENAQINDQFQSLQLIYQDNLAKIDELSRRNSAQDQINKELSQSLLESRKKSEYLEQKLIASEEEFKRKLQAFQVRFNKTPIESVPPQMSEQAKLEQKDLLNKIQSLLSEIQTGHPNRQLSNVEFKEEAPKESNELISEIGDI